jgi:oligopeptide transport system ATP-binding protein
MTIVPLLKVENLHVSFPGNNKLLRRPEVIQAVAGVNLEVARGRTLGLVGESGCGKSTTGYAILRLVEATGRVIFDDVDLISLSEPDMRPIRRRIQVIFQDAASSLDPRMTIGDLIAEALDIHSLSIGRARKERIKELLDLVGLPPRYAERYPHELSGGQAQRIAICRALAVEPELIICDEAVSALDVSIQAQILNLLQKIQERLGLAYIFISHDLSVVRHISDDIAVMYLGKIVEYGSRKDLFENPIHPYTKALLSSVPIPDPDIELSRERIVLEGDLPNPANPPSGCRFRTRCPVGLDECASALPQEVKISQTHFASCIRASRPAIEHGIS